MKIGLVFHLSLVILVSGWFIGTKNWESYTNETDIEKSLCSKTFKDVKNKDIKNCQVIVLNPGYSFGEINQLIPAVVDDVVNEKTGGTTYQGSATSSTVGQTEENEENKQRQKVIEKLESILYLKNAGLEYADLSVNTGEINIQKQNQWVIVIDNYRIQKNVKYEKIADNNVINQKSDLYQQLKKDIVETMKPQQRTVKNQPKRVR